MPELRPRCGFWCLSVRSPDLGGDPSSHVSDDPVFEFDIVRVDTARWLDIGQPGTRLVRQTWQPPC